MDPESAERDRVHGLRRAGQVQQDPRGQREERGRERQVPVLVDGAHRHVRRPHLGQRQAAFAVRQPRGGKLLHHRPHLQAG